MEAEHTGLLFGLNLAQKLCCFEECDCFSFRSRNDILILLALHSVWLRPDLELSAGCGAD